MDSLIDKINNIQIVAEYTGCVVDNVSLEWVRNNILNRDKSRQSYKRKKKIRKIFNETR